MAENQSKVKIDDQQHPLSAERSSRMNWLRLHTEIKTDRQLQQMPAEMFRHLVNIWCIAKEHEDGGKLPKIPDIAFQLRIEEDDCKSLIVKLQSMGLIVKDGDSLAVKNWAFWQSRDDSKNRVRALRSRMRNGSGNGGVTVDVTVPCVTVTATEQIEQIEQSRADVRASLPASPKQPEREIPDLTDAFDGLWNLYPKKGRTREVACKHFFVEILAHLEGDTLARTIAAIRAPLEPGGVWAESDKWAKGYIQNLETYLAQKQWREEPESAAGAKQPGMTEREARIKRQEEIDASWEIT